MKLRVCVTEDDIRNGKVSAFDCPFARATNRALVKAGLPDHIASVTPYCDRDDEEVVVILKRADDTLRSVGWLTKQQCPKVVAFAERFDKWKEPWTGGPHEKPKPMRCTLDIPLR